MTTLPPPGVMKSSETTIEKQVYNLVENFKEYIPVTNDRNRLAFNLYNFVKGVGDPPKISIKTAKINLVGITENELARKLEEKLLSIKK